MPPNTKNFYWPILENNSYGSKIAMYFNFVANSIAKITTNYDLYKKNHNEIATDFDYVANS